MEMHLVGKKGLMKLMVVINALEVFEHRGIKYKSFVEITIFIMDG